MAEGSGTTRVNKESLGSLHLTHEGHRYPRRGAFVRVAKAATWKDRSPPPYPTLNTVHANLGWAVHCCSARARSELAVSQPRARSTRTPRPSPPHPFPLPSYEMSFLDCGRTSGLSPRDSMDVDRR